MRWGFFQFGIRLLIPLRAQGGTATRIWDAERTVGGSLTWTIKPNMQGCEMSLKSDNKNLKKWSKLIAEQERQIAALQRMIKGFRWRSDRARQILAEMKARKKSLRPRKKTKR